MAARFNQLQHVEPDDVDEEAAVQGVLEPAEAGAADATDPAEAAAGGLDASPPPPLAPDAVKPARQCTHCGRQEPGPPGTMYSWRKHIRTRLDLCGRCGAYSDRHQGQLPPLGPEAEGQAPAAALPEPPAQRGGRHRAAKQAAASAWQSPRRRGGGVAKRTLQQPKAQKPKQPKAQARQHKEEQQEAEQRGEQGEEAKPAQPAPELAAAAQAKQCSHCFALRPGPANTKYNWRRHPTTRALLCAMCHRYQDQHGGALPAPPDEGAAALARAAPEPSPERRCLLCGSNRQGSGKWTSWHRHPITDAEWLCHGCYTSEAAAAAAAAQPEPEPEPGQPCSHCGAGVPGPTATYPWRKHPDTGARLCKDCWGFQRHNGGQLPDLVLADDPGSLALAPLVLAVAAQAAEAERATGGGAYPGPSPLASPPPPKGLGGATRHVSGPSPPSAAATRRAPGRPRKRQAAPANAQEQAAPPAKRSRSRDPPAAAPAAAAAAVPPPSAAAEVQAAAAAQHISLSLLSLLLEAAGEGAAAAAGLTPELVGCFWEVLLSSAPEQQAAREGSLRYMLGQRNFQAAAGTMRTALRLAGAPL